MKLKINEVYYRRAKTYNEYSTYNFFAFKCVGYNSKGVSKTARVGAFYDEECAKLFCEAWNKSVGIEED